MTTRQLMIEADAPRDWLIWSEKRGCWYADNCEGYSNTLDRAGCFTEEVAKRHNMPGTTHPVPVAEMADKIEAAALKHEAAAAKLRSMLPVRAASQQEMPEGLRKVIELSLWQTKDVAVSKDDGRRPDSFIDDFVSAQMGEITTEYAKGAGS